MGKVYKRDVVTLTDSAVFDGVPDTACKVIEHYWYYFEDVFAQGKVPHWFTLVHLDEGSSSAGRVWFIRPNDDCVFTEYDESGVDPVAYQRYEDSLEGGFLNSKRLIFSNSWVPLLLSDDF